MFDFSSAGRNEGADPGRNDKGLVTYDRKIKKDAYFFYKAQWTTQPFVHICDRRYSPRPAGSVAIKVYCNCPVVELFINGRSQGIRNPVDHVFIWPAVTLPAGIVHVSATTTDSNGHVYRDEYKLSVVSR
jgi:beta-galactosidase